MFPIFLRIGPVTLHTYGLLVAVGFIVGVALARREFKRLGMPNEIMDHVAILLTLTGIFGARLFYFIAVDHEGFLENPLRFFKVWEGGLVYYGAFIGGIIGAWFYCRSRKIPFLIFADVLTPPLLLAQSIGRLGCFAAGCCYGKPTDSFLGIKFTHPESLAPTFIPLHPTQIYSSLVLLLLFFGLLIIAKDRPPKGMVTSIYLLGYGAFRFLIEFLRNDYRGDVVLGLHPSQWISLITIIVGGVLFSRIIKSHRVKFE